MSYWKNPTRGNLRYVAGVMATPPDDTVTLLISPGNWSLRPTGTTHREGPVQPSRSGCRRLHDKHLTAASLPSFSAR